MESVRGFQAAATPRRDRAGRRRAAPQLSRAGRSSAARLASALSAGGAAVDSLVAISVERSVEMVIALLGVLGSGAGCVAPIDPGAAAAAPAVALRRVGGAPAGGRAGNRIELDGARLMLVDAPPGEGRARAHARPSRWPTPSSRPARPARPRACSSSRARWPATSRRRSNIFALTAADRILQFASLSFDASIEEIFPPLICGACLVLRNQQMLDSPAAFLDTSAAWQVTVLDLPTVYWHELADQLRRLTIPDAVRLAIIGGERADPGRLAAWHQHTRGRPLLLNTYGPTEATVVSTLAPLEPGAPESAQVPIGRAIANMRVYILDERLRPVPPGVAGDLYLAGDGLARGYLGRPDDTAARFLPDPFCADAGQRMYASGDRGRFLADGSVEFLGRRDAQIKVRGHRIEPGEIEARAAQPSRGEGRRRRSSTGRSARRLPGRARGGRSRAGARRSSARRARAAGVACASSSRAAARSSSSRIFSAWSCTIFIAPRRSWSAPARA